MFIKNWVWVKEKLDIIRQTIQFHEIKKKDIFTEYLYILKKKKRLIVFCFELSIIFTSKCYNDSILGSHRNTNFYFHFSSWAHKEGAAFNTSILAQEKYPGFLSTGADLPFIISQPADISN